MSDQPFFSIVVPFYNRSELLPLTIESIVQQTFRNFELILVDDGSTDNSLHTAKCFAAQNVQVFTKENGERGAARNFGARKAKGIYINFFDSDDLMEPEHLENVHRFLQDRNFPPVVYTGNKYVDHTGKLIRESLYHPADLKKALAFNNFLACNGVILKMEVFQQFWFNEDRALSVAEDKEIWLRVAARYPFEFVPVSSFRVVEHPDRSLNTIRAGTLEARIDALISALSKDPIFMHEFAAHFPFIKAHEYSLVSQVYSEEGNVQKAGYYLKKAFKEHPPIALGKRFVAALKKYLQRKLIR